MDDRWGAHISFWCYPAHEWIYDGVYECTVECMTHGLCNALPTVTFPAAEHCHCP